MGCVNMFNSVNKYFIKKNDKMTETLTFLFNRSRQRYFKENICIFKDEDGNFVIVKPNKEILHLIENQKKRYEFKVKEICFNIEKQAFFIEVKNIKIIEEQKKD